MANHTRKKPPPTSERFPRRKIQCEAGATPDEKGEAYAKLINSPAFSAYRVIESLLPPENAKEIDVPGMVATLRSDAVAVQRGDMSQAESMLINQATALQAMFARLSERALGQSHIPYFEVFMRLALRAQSQCRATLETLGEIKNPRQVAFVRQANITNGPQQVNNGIVAPSHAGIVSNQSNELSGGGHELLPDARASQDEGRVNQTLEAVGEVHRPTN